MHSYARQISSKKHNQFDIFTSWHNFCLHTPQFTICPQNSSFNAPHAPHESLRQQGLSLPKATRLFCEQISILNCCVYLRKYSLTFCACPVGIPVRKQVSATF